MKKENKGLFVRGFITLVLTVILLTLCVVLAKQERGYFGVGGEWFILFIPVFWLFIEAWIAESKLEKAELKKNAELQRQIEQKRQEEAEKHQKELEKVSKESAPLKRHSNRCMQCGKFIKSNLLFCDICGQAVTKSNVS